MPILSGFIIDGKLAGTIDTSARKAGLKTEHIIPALTYGANDLCVNSDSVDLRSAVKGGNARNLDWASRFGMLQCRAEMFSGWTYPRVEATLGFQM